MKFGGTLLTEEDLKALAIAVSELDRLIFIDLPHIGIVAGQHSIELIVMERNRLKLKIDGNLNHHRAHLHLDFGKLRHHASYAIDDGELLAGEQTEHHRDIQNWIAAHRELLNRVYREMRESRANDQDVSTLKESQFPLPRPRRD